MFALKAKGVGRAIQKSTLLLLWHKIFQLGNQHQNDLRAAFSLNVPFTLPITVNGRETLCEWCVFGDWCVNCTDL